MVRNSSTRSVRLSLPYRLTFGTLTNLYRHTNRYRCMRSRKELFFLRSSCSWSSVVFVAIDSEQWLLIRDSAVAIRLASGSDLFPTAYSRELSAHFRLFSVCRSLCRGTASLSLDRCRDLPADLSLDNNDHIVTEPLGQKMRESRTITVKCLDRERLETSLSSPTKSVSPRRSVSFSHRVRARLNVLSSKHRDNRSGLLSGPILPCAVGVVILSCKSPRQLQLSNGIRANCHRLAHSAAPKPSRQRPAGSIRSLDDGAGAMTNRGRSKSSVY